MNNTLNNFSSSTGLGKIKLALTSLAIVLQSCGDAPKDTSPTNTDKSVEQTYTVKAEDMVKTVEGGNEATVEEVAVEEVKTEEVKTPSLDDINFDEGFEDDVADAKKDADQAKKDADQAKKDADQAKKDADDATKTRIGVEIAMGKKPNK